MTAKVSAHSNALGRAIAILEMLDRCQEGKSVPQIVRGLNIPRSSAHVLISTLRQQGYVHYDPKFHVYRLGLKAYALGKGLTNAMRLPQLADAHLRWVTERTGVSSTICVLDGEQGLSIAVCVNAKRPDLYVGKRADLHATAVGKVLLAHLRESRLAEFLRKHPTLAQHTINTITVSESLVTHLKKVREEGYALDDEENQIGIRCLAVPLFYDVPRSIAALGIMGDAKQIEGCRIKSFVDTMKQAADRMCRDIALPRGDGCAKAS